MKKTPGAVRQISLSRKIIRFSIIIAAAILLIFILLTIFNIYKHTANDIVARNFIAYDLPAMKDSANDDTRIKTAYRQSRYEQVVQWAADTLTADDNMLVGMSLFELKKFPEAIEYYKKVIEQVQPSRDRELCEAAQFYMSLALLANKKYDSALYWLEFIKSDPSHIYHDKVSNKLIRQVKALKWQ